MSEYDELVGRVAQALAEAEDYEAPLTVHYTLAAEALRVLAPELECEPCRPCPACIDRIRRGAPDPTFHDPPEGCEAVWLPTETVDWWDDHYEQTVPQSPQGITGYACRKTKTSRPKPEPRTERVPAIEALGREVVSDEGSTRPTFTGYSIAGRLTGGLAIRSATGDCCQRIAPDGKVVVLAEDGAE